MGLATWVRTDSAKRCPSLRGAWAGGDRTVSSRHFHSNIWTLMKLTLDNQETLELILEALRNTTGFSDISEVEFDLGDGQTLPLSLIQGLIVNVSR